MARSMFDCAVSWLPGLAFIALWQGVCWAFAPPPYLLPTPWEVAAALIDGFEPLVGSAFVTLGTALLALLLAALIAFPLAALAGTSVLAARAIRPLATTLQVTPVVALAPLALVWAGLEHPGRAVVALAAVVAVFPLFSGLLTGLESADRDLRRVFDLYGAGRWRRLRLLQAPSALPFLLEGIKVGAGLSLIGAVVAEFVAGSGQAQGLAWRVLEAQHQLKTAEMFAALLVLAGLGAGLYAVATGLERAALRRWRGRD